MAGKLDVALSTLLIDLQRRGMLQDTLVILATEFGRTPEINATIGYALGLPLDQVLYSPRMRPFTLADKGKPLVGLFA